MRVKIQSSVSSPTQRSTELRTNENATVDSLIGGFCALNNLPHDVTHGLYASGRLLPNKKTLKDVGIRDGETLHLGYARHYADSSRLRCLCAVSFVILIISLAGFLTALILFTTTGHDVPFEYGVVLDAGSTHTEVAVYNWHGEKYDGTGIVHQVESCDFRRGISSHYLDFEQAGLELVPCMKKAVKAIPEDKVSQTPVFLGATAGMRILKIMDPVIAKALLFSVRCALSTYGFDVRSTEIISGKDEGLHAWITTNFLLRTLQTPDKQNETYAAMDLGGASTQIAYAVNYNTSDDVTTLKLYGTQHQVFSKSYLCFGLKEVYRRYLASLVMEESSSAPEIVVDPCSPSGLKFNQTKDYLFNATCTENANGEMQEKGKTLEKLEVDFEGTGDATKCGEKVRKLLDSETCGNNFKRCFKSPQSVPTEDQKFVAMSTFQFMAKFLNASESGKESDFIDALKNLCKMTPEEILEIPKTGKDFLTMYCFEGYYVHGVLTKYGFSKETWSNIKFAKKIGDTDLGWALGYMINQTNAIPEETEEPPMISLTWFVIVVIVSTFLMLLSTAYLTFLCRKKKKRLEYEEMSENVHM